MSIRFASLGSGSSGNALVVDTGATRILIDCGFGPRILAARLGRLGLGIEDITAVVLTHEHSDHVGGALALAQRYGTEIYLSCGTLRALNPDKIAAICQSGVGSIQEIDSHTAFAIGDLELHPYPVPHDAREPIQYVVSDGAVKLGILTDSGCITPHIVTMLHGCHALVLECNHDIGMLLGGSYPARLKHRIASRFGHLDNQAAADLLQRIDRTRLSHVLAAHLSEENNTPELAANALSVALGCQADWVGVASQDEGFAWRTILTS